jgi:rubrerythrin
MGNTSENLAAAFAGESQASRKYLYFAEKAEQEGQKRAARLFRAASEAETVHARNHLRVLQGIGTTAENLKTAINGENHEFTKMYPDFIDTAKSEGNQKAANSFDLANKVEKIHHKLYSDTMDKINEKENDDLKPFYVCEVCGNTVEGEAPDRCPVCGAQKKMFKAVN